MIKKLKNLKLKMEEYNLILANIKKETETVRSYFKYQNAELDDLSETLIVDVSNTDIFDLDCINDIIELENE